MTNIFIIIVELLLNENIRQTVGIYTEYNETQNKARRNVYLLSI